MSTPPAERSANRPTISNTAFQGFLNERRLMASHCCDCEALYLPPHPLCTRCYSENIEWVQMTGRGVLRAYTVIHIAPTAMIQAGYGRDNPYCAGIVRLEEGPAISAQILGVDVAHPERIRIGAPVEVTFVEHDNSPQGQIFLAFSVVSE